MKKVRILSLILVSTVGFESSGMGNSPKTSSDILERENLTAYHKMYAELGARFRRQQFPDLIMSVSRLI